MKIRTGLGVVGVSMMLAAFLSACGSPLVKDRRSVNHVVLIWFNESVDEKYIHEVAAVSQYLSRIPGVVEIRTGQSVKSERPVVDDSFDLGVLIQFDSVENMKSYVDHPIHKKFVEDYLQGNIQKLMVYDF